MDFIHCMSNRIKLPIQKALNTMLHALSAAEIQVMTSQRQKMLSFCLFTGTHYVPQSE